MNLSDGLRYNLRGLAFGLRTPSLLLLGLLRFFLTAIFTLALAAVICTHAGQILELLWQRPESPWLIWLWHPLSWLLALLLSGLAALAGFLAAQLLFSVVIMEQMSVITERRLAGGVPGQAHQVRRTPFWTLLRQEIPRAILPLVISLGLLPLSWFTPLGPLVTVLSPLAAAVFLAWDNTDLVPARRMEPFAARWAFLRRHLGFHLGFGLPFLIPLGNLLFLSFAPVGATLFHLQRPATADGSRP
jgi:CysZ protein